MRSHPDEAITRAAVGPAFARFEEEVQAAPRPTHATIALGEQSPPAASLLESMQQLVEAGDFADAIHVSGLP